MSLRPADFNEGVWTRLQKHVEARIAELRAQNDGLSLTNDKTLVIRGRIDELKELLALRKRSTSSAAEPGANWPQQTGE